MSAQASKETDPMLEQFRRLGYPEIEPVPAGVHRPRWSVMIPTYNCAALLRETLKSVLAQDPGSDHMHIEVVDDASTKDDPEAVVREIGQGRVAYHRQPTNIGATANFNTCLSRSRGTLLHILHGDDLVLAGFYDRMGRLLDHNREAGAAFCRFVVIDEDGIWTDLSRARQRASGIYPGGLPTLASGNWAQFAAVVVRRSTVEAVGGFHPSLIHAADWDLWKRTALHQPVVYEPTVLAQYRVFEGNDTSRLVRTGADAADIRRAIDLSAQYLPYPESISWIRDARHFFAHRAVVHAAQMLASGDHSAFKSQLREACLLEPAFCWSKGHLQLRIWFMKQWAKQKLLKIKRWFSESYSLDFEKSSAST
jgi:glycosyltransferase involved in cell wall biosynthesis